MYSRRHTIIRSNTFKILTSSVDGAAWSMLKDDGIENCFENCSSSCMLLHLNPASCWSLPLLRNHCSCAREGTPANTPRVVKEYSLNTMRYIPEIPFAIPYCEDTARIHAQYITRILLGYRIVNCLGYVLVTLGIRT